MARELARLLTDKPFAVRRGGGAATGLSSVLRPVLWSRRKVAVLRRATAAS